MDSYCWDDFDLAKKEVQEHYAKLVENHNINEDEILVTGASQGGRLAILLALEERLFKGFIGVIPAITDIGEFLDMVKDREKSRMRGAMITGDKDRFYPQVKNFYDKLLERDFPVSLITEKGLGHYIPGKFPEYIQAAITYITGEKV